MIRPTNICAVRDFRCPACGRVVLNPFEQGAEGRYHPACVQPPAVPQIDWPPRQDWPNYPNPYHFVPHTPTWHLNSCL